MKASEVTLEWLLPQLEGVEGYGDQYYAYCPCHDDVGSSMKGLSITRQGKRILCKCHSPQCGATLTAVIAELNGISDNGSVSVKVTKNPSKKGNGGLSWWAEYTQVEESIWKQLGVEEYGDSVAFLFEDSEVRKVRTPPKGFVFEPKGLEVSPFWPIPADELPAHISITEGESDCGTTYAAGLPLGFTVTKGSDTPLSVEVFQAFASRGVQQITFYKDADNAGSAFVDKSVALAIDAGLACSVCDLTRVVDPFYPVKDINSLWKQTELEQFLDLVERATQTVTEVHFDLGLEDALEEGEKDMDWIIPNLIARGDKILVWGPPKAYKTWITLDLIRSLISGTPFLNRGEWKPERGSRTLLVEEEGNLQLFARRLKRLQIEEGAENFRLLHKQGVKFTEPLSISYLISVCREREIEVLILDPMQRMIPGVNENDAAEMGIVWDQVQRIQEACPGLVICVVHHASKSNESGWGSSRGSSRHGGEVDLGIEIRRHPTEESAVSIWLDGREVYAQLGPDASFMGKIEITDETFTVDATEVQVTVHKKTASQAEDNENAVFMAIRGGCETRTQIMKEAGLSDATVRRYIEILLEKEWIVADPQGEGKPTFYREKEDA